MVGESAAKAALREHFGYEEFRPGQQGVVEAILAGRDALAVLPTGAGITAPFPSFLPSVV